MGIPGDPETNYRLNWVLKASYWSNPVCVRVCVCTPMSEGFSAGNWSGAVGQRSPMPRC